MILVVDDDEQIVETLRTMLQQVGYRVETASNGGEAYEKVKTPDCKCMLLDINMPEVSGAELLLLMQAEDIRIPTIVMAGFDDFDESGERPRGPGVGDHRRDRHGRVPCTAPG